MTYRAGFDRKQNKYVASLKVDNGPIVPNQILFNGENSGIKAHFLKVEMHVDGSTDPGGKKELFSVGTKYKK